MTAISFWRRIPFKKLYEVNLKRFFVVREPGGYMNKRILKADVNAVIDAAETYCSLLKKAESIVDSGLFPKGRKNDWIGGVVYKQRHARKRLHAGSENKAERSARFMLFLGAGRRIRIAKRPRKASFVSWIALRSEKKQA